MSWSETRRQTQTIMANGFPEARRASVGGAHLRLQIVLEADLGEQLDLGLEPVDVLLGVVEDVLQDLARDEVPHALAMGDRGLDGRLRARLGLQVARQQLGDVLADQELAEVLQVRQAIEHEDAFHEAVGVLHLADRLFVFLLGEPLEPPVLEHPVVQEILVRRGQLVLELRIEVDDDLRVAFHAKGAAGRPL